VFELAAVDEVFGTKVFDLTALMDGVGRSVKRLDLGNAGLAGDEVLPELLDTDTDRRNDPKAGNDDAALGVAMFSLRAQ